jgi:AcrR family transcriptional regulator
MSTQETANVRWRRMPERRPRQILEAALVVFGDQGFEHARLEDVAERASVSKGTIYNYFSSKESLFEEMVRQMLGDFLELADTIGDKEDPEEALCEFMAGVWSYVRSGEFETIYRLVMAELHRFPHLGTMYKVGIRDRIMVVSSDILRRGMKTGAFRAMDVDAASRMMLALLVKHGMWRGRPETWPDLAQRTDEQVFQEIWDFYIHGLRPSATDVQVTQRRQA